MNKQIFQNSSWLLLAQVLVKSISFFYNIFLARSLGVEGFGLFSVALTYFAIFNVLSEFGFNRYLIREVAIKSDHISQIVGNVVVVRALWTVAALVVFSVSVYFIGPGRSFLFVITALLAAIPLSLAQVFDSAFIALQKAKYSAIATIFLFAATAILGILLTIQTSSPLSPLLALGLANIFYLLILITFYLRLRLGFRIWGNLTASIMVKTIPYGLLGIIGLLSFKVDTLLLFYLKGSYQTGIYSAGYKFFEAIVFIPNILATVLFPLLAENLALGKLDQLKRIYTKSLFVMLVSGAGLMLIFIFVLPTVIRLLLPKYILSIQVVQILALAIPFTFIHIQTGQVLLSTQRYLKQMLLIFLFLLVINLASFTIVINQFGYLGASVATIFSEILTFVVFYAFLQKFVFAKELK